MSKSTPSVYEEKELPTKGAKAAEEELQELHPSTSLDAARSHTGNSGETLTVAFLANEWGSCSGFSTINRTLAILLAKHPKVHVILLVPQFKCSEEDKRTAQSHNISIREAECRPGFSDPLDWLSFPPRDLTIDIAIGHGAKLGKQAQIIRVSHSCKWVQIVHTEPEELTMYKYYPRAIVKGLVKNRVEVDLCKLADLVVAVGRPKLAEAFSSYLRPSHRDVFALTPGTFADFANIKHSERETAQFNVLTFGRGDSEDFSLKGYDIAASAIAELKDSSYRLIFVGAPHGKQEEVAETLLQTGISRNQLIVRSFVQNKERLKELFCEVDVAIMPSRTKGFGLALEAMSAGLPILVSGNSGFGEALRYVPFGLSCVINSEDPRIWAKAIAALRQKSRIQRLEEIETLRRSYEEKFSWERQCQSLVDRMWRIVDDPVEIEARGPRAQLAYQKALKDGTELQPFTSLDAARSRTGNSGKSLRVALLANEWGSSSGFSTINRILAILLAKHPKVDVILLVPEFQCSEEDKRTAQNHSITIREAQHRPGFSDPLDWLSFSPRDLTIDIVIGHGAKLGKQAQIIRQSHSCKWVQVVHTGLEELAMHKNYPSAIAKGEGKNRAEVDLCKLADLVVAVGSKLTEALPSYLRSSLQDVFQLTPGTFADFADVKHSVQETAKFTVLTFGPDDSEFLSLKGYDISASAIVELKDSSYRLIFVDAPEGKEHEVADTLLKTGISRNQLSVRPFVQNKERLKELFCEVDVAIMPSRTEGFGLTALEAMSAGLPILVSRNSEFGEALCGLPFGMLSVIESEDPREWAKGIAALRQKSRTQRLKEIQILRRSYEKKFSWERQCKFLVDRMWKMVSAEPHDGDDDHDDHDDGDDDDGVKDDNKHDSRIPSEIKARGPKAKLAYENALKTGRKVQVFRTRIMLIGQDRAGKTSLKKSFLGLSFDPEENSTDGIDVDPSKFEFEVDQGKNWQRTDEKLDVSQFLNDLARQVAGKLETEETRMDPQVERPQDQSKETIPKETKGNTRNMQARSDTQIDKDIADEPKNIGNEMNQVPFGKEKTEKPQEAGFSRQFHHMTSHSDNRNRKPAFPQLMFDPALPPDEFTRLLVRHLEGLNLPTDATAMEHHMTLDLWDFAGQQLYYASYPVFLSPRAVYLLIYNLSKGLKETAQPIVRQNMFDRPLENPNKETNLENLLSWLISISTLCSSNQEADENKPNDLPHLRPPVFIVGTHADKPHEDIKKMESQIQKEIMGKKFQGHVIYPFFSVDNAQGSSGEGVAALQKRMFDVLKEEPYMGEEIPLRWLNFEKVIDALVSKQISHLNVEQLQSVAMTKCFITDRKEFEIMVNFYHDLGIIIKHRSTVILKAQWLIELFRQLITIPRFDKMDPVVRNYWKEVQDTGILRMELVDNVFSKFVLQGGVKDDILNMMEHFDLIAKFAPSTTDVKYFVPAQLNAAPDDFYVVELSSSDPCPLYVDFCAGCVPHGLFMQVVSRSICWLSQMTASAQASPMCTPHQEGMKTGPTPCFKLYQNGARLIIGNKIIHHFILICKKRFIKIVLRQRNQKRLIARDNSAEIAAKVWMFLKKTLHDLSKDFRYFRGLRYQFCVACPYCQLDNKECMNHRKMSCTHDDCLHLLEINRGEPLKCAETSCLDELTVDGMDKWFSQRTSQEMRPSSSLEKAQSHSRHSDKPSDLILNKLSHKICTVWQSVGRALGVPEEKIEQISLNSTQYLSVPEKAFQVLKAWKNHGKSVTYDKLCEVLEEHHLNELADSVRAGTV